MEDAKTVSSNFINKFNLIQLNNDGFFGISAIEEGGVGFSAFKNFNFNCDNKKTTLLNVYITDEDFSDANIEKKPLFISAIYGQNENGSISRRFAGEVGLNNPISLMYYGNKYFYNIRCDKFYKDDTEINANEIVKEVYALHIKSSRRFAGFFMRTKIRIEVIFWRKLMKSICYFISKIFHFSLYIISGIRYAYSPIEEIIKTRFEKTKPEMKEKLKEGKKITFFGYEASQWSVVFYSLLHLLGYIIFIQKEYKPLIIAIILKNNFLTLIYVIASLCIIEVLLPQLFMVIIKFFSEKAEEFLYRNIQYKHASFEI